MTQCCYLTTECRYKDGFAGVEAVCGLAEDDASGRPADLAGHLQTFGHAGVPIISRPTVVLGIVERRPAVHERDPGVADALAYHLMEHIGLGLLFGDLQHIVSRAGRALTRSLSITARRPPTFGRACRRSDASGLSSETRFPSSSSRS